MPDQRQHSLAEVTQDITIDMVVPMPGNCLQAALASLLGRELEEVPHFVALEHWWDWALTAWMDREGLELQWQSPGGYIRPGTYHLIGGRSPRDVRHVVVGLDGEPVWDPHPSRAGLLPHSSENGCGWQLGFVFAKGEIPPFARDRRAEP
jgi:hypothetical protein